MVSNVLASAAILRRPFSRLRYLGLLGTACSVGLIPLVLHMPESTGGRYGLLVVVCLFAGRKVVQYFRGHAALKQISMEEHFLRYIATGGSIQKCVENENHMWARSRILGGLRTLATNRFPSNMLVSERHQRVLHRYQHAFQELMPRSSLPDILLILVFGIMLALTPTSDVDFGAFIYQAGFLALIVAVIGEGSHLIVNRRLHEGLNRLFQTLTDWTIREGLQKLERTGPYAHHLHYFAPPWFATVATPAAAEVMETLDVAAEPIDGSPPSMDPGGGDPTP